MKLLSFASCLYSGLDVAISTLSKAKWSKNLSNNFGWWVFYSVLSSLKYSFQILKFLSLNIIEALNENFISWLFVFSLKINFTLTYWTLLNIFLSLLKTYLAWCFILSTYKSSSLGSSIINSSILTLLANFLMIFKYKRFESFPSSYWIMLSNGMKILYLLKAVEIFLSFSLILYSKARQIYSKVWFNLYEIS